MAQVKLILLLVIVVVGVIWWQLSLKMAQNMKTVNIKLGEKEFQLEVAKSMVQRSKGLSGRENLDKGKGMIFVFDYEGSLVFWMKDTLIPLDMIWLDSKGEVVDVATAEPEIGVTISKLKQYSNKSPAKYVIELNAGQAEQAGIKIGDKILLPEL